MGQVIPVQIYVHVQREAVCVVVRTWILKPEDVLPVTSVRPRAALSNFVASFLTVKMEIIKAPAPWGC